jgi:hypothetical protein
MSKNTTLPSPVRDQGYRSASESDRTIGPHGKTGPASSPAIDSHHRGHPSYRNPRREAITGNQLTGERRLPNEFDENKLRFWTMQAAGGIESEIAKELRRRNTL